MTTQSPSPPISTPQNKGDAEIGQPENVDQQNAGEDPAKQSSKASVFVNLEPMREEQVQNAVKFLSHPKVRSSPVIYRRTFLEKKGLTKEEIDEAFQRVPDSQPSAQTTGGNQVILTNVQLKPASDVQRQAQPQALHPGVSDFSGVTTSSKTSSRISFRWSHALIAVGLVVASGAGTAMLIKKSILPRLKSWMRNIVLEEECDQLKITDSKPTLAEEAAQAAKAAAAAAADMAKASQEIMTSKCEERRYFVEVVSLLDKQVQEMKLMTNAIRRLEASSGVSFSKPEDQQVTQTSSKTLMVNGKGDYDLRPARPSSPPASSELSSAPHPKSYMEIMAMIQRGEKPSNIRDIDDSPPNPHQQPSNPRLAPRAKPWEVGQVQQTSTPVFQSQVNGKDLNFNVQDNGDKSTPWWQANNSRIREIDNGAPYGAVSSQKPVQRVWVPPQPPPIAMPEAAEAIRRAKPLVQTGETPDDQSVAHSSNISDKVEKISELSKSEGAIEGSNANSLLGSAEIVEEHEVNQE